MNFTSLDFLNKTEFENDPFDEVDESELEYHGLHSWNYMMFYAIALGFFKLVLCLIVISADIFLIVVICRFRRLRTRINMYILHTTLLNLAYLLGTHLYFILGYFLLDNLIPSMVLLQTQSTVLLLYVTFAILLATDWFLSGYNPNFIKTYHMFYRYVFASLYLIFLVEWIIAFIYLEEHHIVRAKSFLILFLIYLVFLIIANILKRKMNFKNDCVKIVYALTISNIILFSFVPMLCFYFLLHWIPYETFQTILLYLEFIPEFISLCHPLLVVYMLGRQNKHFKIAYNKSFKRSIRDYEDEDLDGITEDENPDRNNKVQVNYLNGNQLDDKKLILEI